MAQRISVVLSQGQSNNPAKRKLEETIVTELMLAGGMDVLVIPHLYDLDSDSSALIALQGLGGDFVLLSWLYPRAAHWTLDRHNIRGQLGKTSLKSPWDERKKKWEKQTKEYRPDEDTPRVIDNRPLPDRTIYHLDLRMEDNSQVFIDEIHRMATEQSTHVVNLQGGLNGASQGVPMTTRPTVAQPTVSEQPVGRRWYPVIDFSRCTNCMECIDFCLFGVYGIDEQETILVELPDNCRKGCPACSRVCPENAIIFPQHKTPVIAGDPSIGGEMKIDLSQLFGKPNNVQTAARERDEQLRLAGREAVGVPAAPQARGKPTPDEKDELDDLIDELDQMDL